MINCHSYCAVLLVNKNLSGCSVSACVIYAYLPFKEFFSDYTVVQCMQGFSDEFR